MTILMRNATDSSVTVSTAVNQKLVFSRLGCIFLAAVLSSGSYSLMNVDKREVLRPSCRCGAGLTLRGPQHFRLCSLLTVHLAAYTGDRYH